MSNGKHHTPTQHLKTTVQHPSPGEAEANGSMYLASGNWSEVVGKVEVITMAFHEIEEGGVQKLQITAQIRTKGYLGGQGVLEFRVRPRSGSTWENFIVFGNLEVPCGPEKTLTRTIKVDWRSVDNWNSIRFITMDRDDWHHCDPTTKSPSGINTSQGQ